MAKKHKFDFPLSFYCPDGNIESVSRELRKRLSVLHSLEILQMFDAVCIEHPDNKPLISLMYLLLEKIISGDHSIKPINELLNTLKPLGKELEVTMLKQTPTDIKKSIIDKFVGKFLKNTDDGEKNESKEEGEEEEITKILEELMKTIGDPKSIDDLVKSDDEESKSDTTDDNPDHKYMKFVSLMFNEQEEKNAEVLAEPEDPQLKELKDLLTSYNITFGENEEQTPPTEEEESSDQ